MKILWTVNTFNQNIADAMGIKSSHAISWVEAMSDYLSKCENLSLAIAAPCELSELSKKIIDGIIYYAVPSNDNAWKNVINDFCPDIIHEYGTEKSHNLIVHNVASNIPIVVSLQGILSEYQRHYYAGVDMSIILRYSPLRDWIRHSGFITGRIDFKKRSKREVALLKESSYVEGRSTWDRVAALKINPKLNYYYCPRMLRKSFNESEAWNINDIERHTILISQGNYPIKGVHFAFMAVAALKAKYPDIKLMIAGNNIFSNVKGWHRVFRPGYVRYLYDLAKETNILDNIYFTGSKDSKGMVALNKTAHVAVVPSSIENAPNSLAEAMMIGTPCIASYVGGNMDMLKHNEEGFLYCYNEPYMLAEYIDRIFESDKLAVRFSENSRATAKNRHDPKALIDNILQIYLEIILDYREKANAGKSHT